MQFRIDSNSRTPIYRQLTQQIRAGIATGKLAFEEKLPSVRELSRALVVNPNTIARVYTELEREGVLNTRQGLGVFVARPRAELTRGARRERVLELIDALLTEAVHLGFTAEEITALIDERVGRYQWGAVELQRQ
ncbi:MAG: GntR family transcriptional regulator [Planctomycetes bacterium]|nr:GntR family transcriptional regulator [Planctomycetota bacterium]